MQIVYHLPVDANCMKHWQTILTAQVVFPELWYSQLIKRQFSPSLIFTA